MQPETRRRQIPVILGWTLLLAVLGLGLRREPGGLLVRASYDAAQVVGHAWEPAPTNPPVLLVYLDSPSYVAENQDPTRPWDRGLHARLLDRIRQGGARAVVFDILFDRPGPDPVADRRFGEAMRASGNVILAGELVPSSHAPGSSGAVRSHTIIPPAAEFREAAAGWGLANLQPDADFVVRRAFAGFDPEREPTLAWAAARFLGIRTEPGTPGARWIRYHGPPLALPHLSYTHALDPDAVDAAVFRDRVVLIGARPMTAGVGERRDEFRSPLRAMGEDQFLPAVEVHATQLYNLLRQDSLRRASAGFEIGLLGMFAGWLGWGVVRWRPWRATVLILATAVGLLLVVAVLFGRGFWGAWLVVVAGQLPVALAGCLIVHSVDWYRTRLRLEAARRLADARIREQAALLDKAHDAILVEDLAGGFSYANPAAVRLYGWSAAELALPGTAARLFAPSADVLEGARQTLTATGEWQGELEQATRSGQTVLVASRWTLIREAQGAPRSVLMLHTDVTERRRLESQIVRTQRLQAVWSLASGMAHDLNNALAPVLMGLQRLRGQARDPGARELLAAMEANTRRGAEMVRQVLAFSRGRDDALEVLNPGRLLQEMERIAAQTFPASIRVSLLVPPDLWPVAGNPTRLHQVLLNLCVNAREAMPAGGELTLAADNVLLGAAEAQELPGAVAGDYVMLLVADTGGGIPAEVWPHLFEPFFTTKGAWHGTGLGLSTSFQIVRGHGGFMNVRSDSGAGATFEVYLPRATSRPVSAPAVPPAPSTAAEAAPGGAVELLVIQPASTLRQLLRSSLEELGCRVREAADGPTGLRALADANGRVQAVFLGGEPSGEPLPATLTAIRRDRPRLPILVLGDHPALADAVRQDRHTHAMPHPLDPAVLGALLAQLGILPARGSA